MNENQGLGCIICKGPSEVPGIIVQKLKPDGVAIESGLTPGDKILECNGISLEGMSFQDAVYQLKSSRKLDLMVKKGAAINFVTEKNNQTSIKINTESEKLSSANGIRNPSKLEQGVELEAAKIQLELTKIDIDRKRLELEQEKLKQRSEELQEEKKQFEDEKRRTLLTLKKSQSHDPNVPLKLMNQSMISDDSDTPSTTSTGGLAGAIQNELLRRKANARSVSNGNLSAIEKNNELRSKKLASVTSGLKNDQHDQLIAEFRKVHQKIIKSSSTDDDTSLESSKGTDKLKVTFKDDCGDEKRRMINGEDEDTNHGLSRPNKSPPPPPPIRSSSITPISSLSSDGSNVSIKSSSTSLASNQPPILSTFKPNITITNKALNSSPDIPSPDYDLVSENRSVNGSLHKQTNGKYVNKHQIIEANIPSLLSSSVGYIPPSSLGRGPNNTVKNLNEISNNTNMSQSRHSTQGKQRYATNPMKKQNFINSVTSINRSNFVKRHPPVMERVELPSFIIEEPVQKVSQEKDTIRPPPYYFEPERIAPPLVSVAAYDYQQRNGSGSPFHRKLEALKANHRYSYSQEDLSRRLLDEGSIAAKDYRASNAGKNCKPKVQHESFRESSKGGGSPQEHFISNASLKLSKASSQSYTDISQSNKDKLGSNKTKDTRRLPNNVNMENVVVPQKPKKYPAPPPPPPPPLPSLAFKGIS